MAGDSGRVAARLRALVESRSSKRTRKTVREILNLFGFERRGSRVLELIEEALAEAGLAAPELADAAIDERVTLSVADDEEGLEEAYDGEEIPSALETSSQPLVVQDVLRDLFTWESDQHLDLFRKSMDSANSVAVFLVPKGKTYFPKAFTEDFFRRSLAFKDRSLRPKSSWKDTGTEDEDEQEPSFDLSGWRVFSESETLALLNDGQGSSVKAQARFEKRLSDWGIDHYNETKRLWLFFVPNLSLVPSESLALDKLVVKIRARVPATFTLRAAFADQSEIAAVPGMVERITASMYMLTGLGGGHPSLNLLGNSVDMLYPQISHIANIRRGEAKNTADWTGARFGYESEEHILLKALASTTLKERCGQEPEWEKPRSAGGEGSDSKRPDLSIEGEAWVEVETTRGVSGSFTDYFTSILKKMLDKARYVSTYREFWLVLPSAVYVIHPAQCANVKRRLQDAFGEVAVKLMAGDFEDGRLREVILPEIGVTRVQMQDVITEAPPATEEKMAPLPELGEAIAGYAAEVEQLTTSILRPLRVRRQGVPAANGVLMYGPPGCGKSFIADALARASGMQYLKIGPSDVIDEWLGTGVVHVRALFDKARAIAPCIVVIDELDALLPSRSARVHSNMHVDQKNLVDELLVQMNNASQDGIVVIGTTNRVSDVDDAAVRSGRFDIKMPIFPPNPEERRAIILHELAQPGRVSTLTDDHLITLVQRTPLYTSSDLAALVGEAARQASSHSAETEDVRITWEDMHAALQCVQRSLSPEALKDWLNDVRRWNPGHRRMAQLQAEIKLV